MNLCGIRIKWHSIYKIWRTFKFRASRDKWSPVDVSLFKYLMLNMFWRQCLMSLCSIHPVILHPLSLIISFWLVLQRDLLFTGPFLLFMTVKWWRRLSRSSFGTKGGEKRMMNNTGIIKELHHLNKGQCDWEIMEKGVKNEEGQRRWERKERSQAFHQ